MFAIEDFAALNARLAEIEGKEPPPDPSGWRPVAPVRHFGNTRLSIDIDGSILLETVRKRIQS